LDHPPLQDSTQERHLNRPADRTDVAGRLVSGIRRIGALGEEPLYGVQATREIEASLASALPPFELMTRAGDSVARAARAIAPHARCIWIACGPGNNGGDGLVAARRLIEDVPGHHRPPEVCVTLCGEPARLPADAARALAQAMARGLTLAPHPPAHCDLVIDALLGIGARAAPQDAVHEQLVHMHRLGVPVLCVDLPSGLMADTGDYLGPAAALANAPRHTLALLTLKPGLFTADGRDQAGTVWLDTLGSDTPRSPAPTAILRGAHGIRKNRPHASHKGLQGDVVVVGGQGIAATGAGMTGAAVLAARAALHAGAGRVYLGLLEGRDGPTTWDPGCPELMFRRLEVLLEDLPLLQRASVVCGCGGGSALAVSLPRILSACPTLVLDADALNAVSGDAALKTLLMRRHARGWTTVLTPHPLEAARLLGLSTREVMKDRISAAYRLSQLMGSITVLKGSGTVVQAPGEVPYINASGNASLATAGTGDVLAGWIGAALGRGTDTPTTAVLDAVFHHGQLADRWVSESDQALTADRLAAGIPRLW
jgi:ADP-dependent NAD(P)H-hydrate dehydratase / NAD(P)H-hydrate epimerase